MRFLIASVALLFSLISVSGIAGPPPLAAYGRLPAIENVVLSPSGQQIAFVAASKDQRSLRVQKIGGGVVAMAAVDALKLRSIEWAGEDLVLVRTSQHVNLGFYFGYHYNFDKILALDLATRKVRSVSGGGRWFDAVFGSYGLSWKDGRWFGAYALRPVDRSIYSGDTFLSGDHADLIGIDLQSGDYRKLDGGSKDSADWLIGKDGAVLANAQYQDRSGEWRLYADARSERLLDKAADPLGRNQILGQGRTAGTVLYLRHDQNGAVHYIEAALSAQTRPVEILQDVAVDDFEFDPVSGLLSGYYRQGDTQRLEMFGDAAEARVRGTRKAFPGLNVSFGSWSDDFNRITVKTEGPDDAGTWWLVDIPSGKATVIGAVYPDVPGDQVGALSMVDYRAADGLALRGVLTLPRGVKADKLPLVVLPHGGPEARDYPVFDWEAQAYASRGYAVWQPNFRGSAGYGIGFRKAGDGQWGRRMQTDISDGVAELARRGLVDPARACIVGSSYGGYAALAGVTIQQGLYRCAVSYAGVSDLNVHLLKVKERYGEYAMRYLLAFVGASHATDPALEQISPAKLAARADAPILLIHGKEDTTVSIQQSNLMKRALEKASKPVEMLVLDGEDHYLSREPPRIAMLQAAVAFVERHNPVAR